MSVELSATGRGTLVTLVNGCWRWHVQRQIQDEVVAEWAAAPETVFATDDGGGDWTGAQLLERRAEALEETDPPSHDDWMQALARFGW